MSFTFFNDFQYIIDQVVDPATKSTLQKAYTILVAIDALQPIDDMFIQRDKDIQPVIGCIKELNERVEACAEQLREAGWVYCPNTTPPNFIGQRAWMHPYYARQSEKHRHTVYIEAELDNETYFHVTLYHPQIEFYEHKNLDAVMNWMDKRWGVDHDND